MAAAVEAVAQRLSKTAKRIQRMVETPVSLPNITKLHLEHQPGATPGKTGIRHFVRELLPAVRFHNYNKIQTAFRIPKENPPPFPRAIIGLADGKEVTLNVSFLREKDILKKIVSVNNGEITADQLDTPLTDSAKRYASYLERRAARGIKPKPKEEAPAPVVEIIKGQKGSRLFPRKSKKAKAKEAAAA